MSDCTAVSLARYARRIGYRECAFFGVAHPDNAQYECRAIWTRSQRDMIAWALAEAQDEIEQEVGYFLVPKWTVNERRVYRSPLLTRWGHVISGGVKSDAMLDAGATVTYTSDPATVTISLPACDAENIHVYHPGTDDEIEPESIVLSSASAVISIPWCRLVSAAHADNPVEGWDYNDPTIYEATVDVRCITNDPSTQGVLVVSPISACTATPCTDTEYSACIHIRQPEIGSVDLSRADYADGTWTHKTLCYQPSWVELNYYAGLTELTRQAEDTVIRLAHSKMPDEPCGCQVTQALWRRDRNVPQVLTRERINCPFGLSDGAWWAWRQAEDMKLVRGSVL